MRRITINDRSDDGDALWRPRVSCNPCARRHVLICNYANRMFHHQDPVGGFDVFENLNSPLGPNTLYRSTQINLIKLLKPVDIILYNAIYKMEYNHRLLYLFNSNYKYIPLVSLTIKCFPLLQSNIYYLKR